MTNAMFVDLANLYYCVSKRFPNRKLDYSKLYSKANELCLIDRAIAYGTQANEEALAFISCLKGFGFDTKYKSHRVSDDNERRVVRKADWDVGITLDIVRILSHKNHYDNIILCSTNIELLELVRWIREQGVRVIILACGIPRELREAADSVVEITEDLLETTEST